MGLNQVEPIGIDMDRIDSIKAARKVLGMKTKVLYVLINIAGIGGSMPQTPLKTDISEFRQIFETNFFGVIEVSPAFIDLLKQSPEPGIVNVTSGLGSLTLQNDPSRKHYLVKSACYVPSKAALNAYTIVLACVLRNTSFKINAVDPGCTATDFNNHSGPGTVPDASARVVNGHSRSGCSNRSVLS